MKIEAEEGGKNCGLLQYGSVCCACNGPWVREVTQRENCARKSCTYFLFQRERNTSSNKNYFTRYEPWYFKDASASAKGKS